MTIPKLGRQKPREMMAGIRSVEDNERQFEISFSSEEPVNRWFGSEILLHDQGAVDLQRLNEIGVVLFNHGRDNLGKMPIGKPIKTWIENGRGKAIIEFDDDAESELIRKKVESGTLKGVSVGYEVDSWEEVVAGKISSNGRFTGPAYIALRWRPLEISIVSIPADATVGVGREYEDLEGLNVVDETVKKEDMVRDKPINEPNPAPIGKSEDERALAAEQERQRSLEIVSVCRQFDVDPTAYIKDNLTVDQVRSNILNKIVAERAPITSSVEVTVDAGDKYRNAGSDAILLRAGLRIEKPSEGALEMRAMSLRDLAIEALIADGKPHASVLRMDNDVLFREALSGTGAFSALLDNTVNKSMKKGYQAANTTFEMFTSKGTLNDFRPAKRYQISEAGDLQLLKENGEIKQDQVTDFGVNASLATFAKGWSITRQALINDDIDILTKIPMAYVRAAKRGINKLVYSMIGANPAIYDGKALFDVSHKNIAAVSGGISVATIGAGRAAMRTQTNLRGKEVLNLSPAFLIAPAAIETSAETFLNSLSDPASNNANVRNVFNGKLQLVVDAELDAYSQKAWYLASNPMDCDTIEVSYLNGKEDPTLESRVSFDTLGMNFRIFIDYGVNIIDYRGMFKNIGE